MSTDRTTAETYKRPLTLIGPAATDFRVYGDDLVQESARAWARNSGYVLVTGVPKCAHGFYGMDSCPSGRMCTDTGLMDHVNLWTDTELQGPVNVFLLSHVYSLDRDLAELYARMHGLKLTIGEPHHDWYGLGATPVRLGISSDVIWPLEVQLISLLRLFPWVST